MIFMTFKVIVFKVLSLIIHYSCYGFAH